MILDCHTHLACPEALPAIFYRGWQDNIARLLPPGLPERHRLRIQSQFGPPEADPGGDRHVAAMDAAGIDAAVSLIVDFGVVFPDQVPPLEEVYALHRAVAERHPGRFLLFAGVDPRRGVRGLELFERSLRDWGFRGLKLYPPCGFSPSDPSLDPFYALCQEHGVPVLTHLGPTSPVLSFQHTRPEDVEPAAFRHPKVDFILAHGAVVHREAAGLLAGYRPNVYIDTSGFQVLRQRREWAQTLSWFKQQGLVRKLLFGTDWPIHRQYGDLDSAHAWQGGPLTDRELGWLMVDTPREVLGIQ